MSSVLRFGRVRGVVFSPLVVSALCAGVLSAQDPATRKEGLARPAGEPPPPTGSPQAPPPSSNSPLRITDVSLNVMVAGGASTERDAVLSDLQGGGHDPRKRGFTLQQAELSVSGAVDTWLTAEAYIVAYLDPLTNETFVELEEAFATTQSLPEGLQIKAGHYLTEFGRINSTHPDDWDWMDQPIILTRVFGPDGMRAPGARVRWLLPTEHSVELFAGVQNANGETMASLLANEEYYTERPIGGRPFVARDVQSFGDMAWSARLATGFDLAATQSLKLGVSAVLGPNATGEGATTVIYGADFGYQWKAESNEHGGPFVHLTGEFVARDFDAAQGLDVDGTTVIPAQTLHDYGGYLQALYGFTPGLDAGLRWEWVTGSGASYQFGDASALPPTAGSVLDRNADIFRGDRTRLSPMLQYHTSEFSRIRLQYNYDNVANELDGVGDAVHSIWLGFEFAIGKHPEHEH